MAKSAEGDMQDTEDEIMDELKQTNDAVQSSLEKISGGGGGGISPCVFGN